MYNIIALIGNEGVGKDTFAEFVPEANHIAFADSLRESVSAVVGDIDEFKERNMLLYRTVMRDISIVFRRLFSYDGYSPFTISASRKLQLNKLNIITDLRYVNEYLWLIRSGYDVRFIHIKRSEDDELEGYEFDKIMASHSAKFEEIVNDGTHGEYRTKVLNLIGCHH